MQVKVGLIVGIAHFLAENGVLGQPRWQAIEYFAGCASWSQALRAGGLAVASYELLDDRDKCDILGDSGFITAVQLLLQVSSNPSRLGFNFGPSVIPNISNRKNANQKPLRSSLPPEAGGVFFHWLRICFYCRISV